MKNGTRVISEHGETGVIVRSIGMCYDVKMDATGEVLSGGKKRWKLLGKGSSRATTQDKTTGQGSGR